MKHKHQRKIILLATAITGIGSSAALYAFSGNSTASTSTITHTQTAEATQDWQSQVNLRLQRAMNLHHDTLELSKCYEALAASGDGVSKQWTDFQIDLLSMFFQPVIDEASDIALAVDFVLDKVESGEINAESYAEILAVADNRLDESAQRINKLQASRDRFIIRARTLAGSDEAKVTEALNWGADVNSKLRERIAKALD